MRLRLFAAAFLLFEGCASTTQIATDGGEIVDSGTGSGTASDGGRDGGVSDGGVSDGGSSDGGRGDGGGMVRDSGVCAAVGQSCQASPCCDGVCNSNICDLAPPLDCGSTANGQSEARVCFTAATVPFGSTCTSAQQTRTCVAGAWSPDWPSCASLTCQVAAPAACDGQPHGSVEGRTCYDAASVLYGQTCTGSSQSRTCVDGQWSPGYPSCAFLSCFVEQGVRCGSTLHGTYESRACFDSPVVAYGAECTFNWQDRRCLDGGWAPDYGACSTPACSVGGPPDYSAEHGWVVNATGCTPNIDEREYESIAIWGNTVYATHRGDTTRYLHTLDATTGAFIAADRGYGTGGLGIVVDSTGVYTAGQLYQDWFLEKRDHTTLAHVPAFGSYVPGVRRGANETLLRLEGREGQLWILVERYTPPSGDEWVLSKLSGTDAGTDSTFGASGIMPTTVRVESGDARPEFALTLGASHLYLAVRTDADHVRIEKRDLQTGALVQAFGESGLLTVASQRQGSTSAVSVFEHLGRLYLGSTSSIFQLNAARGNIVWRYDANFLMHQLIADETGVYVDDRLKLGHDGAALWTSTTIAARRASIALSGHWLYAGGNRAYTGSACSNMRYRDLLGRQSRYDGLLHP